MAELTYTQNGDYLVPDITITEQTRAVGKYGRMRMRYLREHRPVLYSSLVLGEKLHPHLLEIEDEANQRLEQMMTEMAKAEGITEDLKAKDQMRWVGEMNNLHARVEETILAEVVYK